MKKLIVNENTLALAQRQMILAYKECYLALQHALLTFFKDSKDIEGKKKLKKQILELGQIYQETLKNMEKSGIY